MLLTVVSHIPRNSRVAWVGTPPHRPGMKSAVSAAGGGS
jgi:hypothetical protein